MRKGVTDTTHNYKVKQVCLALTSQKENNNALKCVTTEREGLKE